MLYYVGSLISLLIIFTVYGCTILIKVVYTTFKYLGNKQVY